MSSRILTDLALARRLDRAEGTANARFVEARAQFMPEVGAEWIEVAGAYAMFDGAGSPCTQTFGLGLFETPADQDLDRIERFYSERGAATAHDVSPLAGVRVYQMLCERGYRPVECSQVMYLPLDERPCASGGAVSVRTIGKHESGMWTQTATAGWASELPSELMNTMPELMRIMASRGDAPSFLAEIDGEPVGAGAYFEHDGVALLAGASTIPKWRKRGAQRALLHARLEYAARSGCEVAMVCTEPGSGSQRNAERNGFRIGYTRTKWELPAASPRTSGTQ